MDDRKSVDLESLGLESMGLESLDLGTVLRAARRRADLSQRDLALRSGLAQPFVARIESGAVENPTFRTIERLLQAAGATLSLSLPSAEQPAGPNMAGPNMAGLGVAGPNMAGLGVAGPNMAGPNMAGLGVTWVGVTGPEVVGSGAAGLDGVGLGLPDGWRDRAGRHYPAHLDAVVTHMEAWQKAGRESSAMRGRSSSDTVPSHTAPSVSFGRLRSARDERRARYARGAAATVVGPAPGGVRGDGRAWGRVWTARLDSGEVVGKLWAHDFDELVDGRAVRSLVTVPPGTMVLDGVVVAEEWRQLGIGRRLVGALRSAGTAAVVTLAVGNALESFLASCGFEPTRSLLPPRWLVSRAV